MVFHRCFVGTLGYFFNLVYLALFSQHFLDFYALHKMLNYAFPCFLYGVYSHLRATDLK